MNKLPSIFSPVREPPRRRRRSGGPQPLPPPPPPPPALAHVVSVVADGTNVAVWAFDKPVVAIIDGAGLACPASGAVVGATVTGPSSVSVEYELEVYGGGGKWREAVNQFTPCLDAFTTHFVPSCLRGCVPACLRAFRSSVLHHQSSQPQDLPRH